MYYYYRISQKIVLPTDKIGDTERFEFLETTEYYAEHEFSDIVQIIKEQFISDLIDVNFDWDRIFMAIIEKLTVDYNLKVCNYATVGEVVADVCIN